MLFNYIVNYSHSHTCALAYGFSGKEGIEHLFKCINVHSTAVICDFNVNIIFIGKQLNPYFSLMIAQIVAGVFRIN